MARLNCLLCSVLHILGWRERLFWEGKKSLFLLPSLTTMIPWLNWQVRPARAYSLLGYPCDGQLKPHVVALHAVGLSLRSLCWERQQKRKGIPYSHSCPGGQDNGQSILEENLLLSVDILWVDFGCLADVHPTALASSLRGHRCCQHLDADIQYTTSRDHGCCWSPHAILNPCSCTSPCPVAWEKDNHSSILAGLGSFLNMALK